MRHNLRGAGGGDAGHCHYLCRQGRPLPTTMKESGGKNDQNESAKKY